MGRKHTTRHAARRKLVAIGEALDTVNTHLAEINSWYEDTHPEIGNALLAIGTVVEGARKLTLDLRAHM